MRIDQEGIEGCPHDVWEDKSYNDWGFPYFVARCFQCGREVSSPTDNVYEIIQRHKESSMSLRENKVHLSFTYDVTIPIDNRDPAMAAHAAVAAFRNRMPHEHLQHMRLMRIQVDYRTSQGGESKMYLSNEKEAEALIGHYAHD